jgi:hypothetical protein
MGSDMMGHSVEVIDAARTVNRHTLFTGEPPWSRR